MFDENAFGILIEYWNLEDDEYAHDDTEEFVRRFTAFERSVLAHCAERPPARPLSALTLGHACYLEFEVEAVAPGLLGWLRSLREALREEGLETCLVLCHGGRWRLDAGEARPITLDLDGVTVVRAALPSEPLRRALLGASACRGGGIGEAAGWGPGTYLDTEAMSALGLAPRNAPTLLEVAGVHFLRLA